MAIDDDPLLIHARQLSQENSDALTIAKSVIQTVANVFLPSHIGECITGLMGAVSQQRWNERVTELLNLFAERVSDLTDEIPDQMFYGSEEFQALLIEAIDQQRTNRFLEKRRLLASGLARSGTSKFCNDQDKELYVRIVRDVIPKDVNILRSFRGQASDAFQSNRAFPGPSWSAIGTPPVMESSCRRLEGLGLLKSHLSLSSGALPSRVRDLNDLANQVNNILKAKTQESFQITSFGRRFLDFLSEEERKTE